MNTPRLTIVLPLKGRQLFTLRFLWHADSEKLPYRFVIADGQVAPKLASLLENSRELFPNLDIDYVRYPDDADFGHYFRKIADALHRVRTPYVMLADNDDFLVFTGLERSMDFLDAKLDYVCCGGGIAGFALYSPAHDGLVGPFNQFTYRYAARDRSFDAGLSSSAERLVSGFNNSWSYYAVFRSAALLEIWQDVVQIDFSDLQLLEIFCAMRTLTLGKARSDPATVAYLRQYWTSLRSAFPNDWVHHLLRSRFSTDFGTMVGRVSGVVASSDDCDEANIAERLREHCEPWLRAFLRGNYGTLADIRRMLRNHAPGLLMWAKTHRRLFVGQARRQMISRLHSEGASAEYIQAFRNELSRIEEVVTGRDFRIFLEEHGKRL